MTIYVRLNYIIIIVWVSFLFPKYILFLKEKKTTATF